MTKNLKFLIFFLVLVLVLIIFADANKEKPIDWSPNFELHNKNPFGLHVFNQENSGLFKNQQLEKFPETPYEFFYEEYNTDYSNNYDTYSDTISYTIDSTTNNGYRKDIKGAIFSVSEMYKFDTQSTEELLYFAKEGNTVFLSCTNFPEALKDSLQFNVLLKNADAFAFENSVISFPNKFLFNKEVKDFYFNKFNTKTTKILGNTHDKEYVLPNFIEITHGKGKFLLHLQPIAFTNYYLLQNNYKYTEAVCSYITNKNIYWHIEGANESEISNNPLRFIFSQPALKWAWYLGLFGILIFMLFNAKRRQRIIPILEPIKNTTIEFAKTIGNLYFLEKNHKDIAQKKIVYFLEKIRTEFFLETTILDETFVNRLQQKTGKEKITILKTVNKINFIKNNSDITEKDLIELNTLIEKLNL